MRVVNRSKKLHKTLEKKVLSNAEGRAAYEAFALQFELAEKMKKARKKAHLSQSVVAMKMGTKPPAISRMESVVPNKKIPFPSILTLMKYALAIGKKLQIDFIEKRKTA